MGGYYGSLCTRPEKNVTTPQKGQMTTPSGQRNFCAQVHADGI